MIRRRECRVEKPPCRIHCPTAKTAYLCRMRTITRWCRACRAVLRKRKQQCRVHPRARAGRLRSLQRQCEAAYRGRGYGLSVYEPTPTGDRTGPERETVGRAIGRDIARGEATEKKSTASSRRGTATAWPPRESAGPRRAGRPPSGRIPPVGGKKTALPGATISSALPSL